ncbi:restriction modification system DNA specificity domain protein [Thioalkalivibrio sp. K90mix]|uniref:restriction endonuclease subunit S n=1 Tax=Thioalkalivibrio sp. (strain K90mix) TaxID=396595 RepID=UPI000195A618|nr:restriction endonuclease subunit S [Thioalkalivibrio sp. K90mix]ADC72130.1 restriction modification system DNA specificity domain protein [Thioalkalivibrio sp. K90mix]
MREGWKTAKLSELCDIQLGKTPARANSSYWDQERSTGNVWLSIADLLKSEANNVSDSKEYLSDKGAKLCKIVKKGTLLVSFKLTLGRVAFAGKDLYTNEAIAALTIHDEQIINRDYLFYFLHFFDWVKAAQDDVKLKGMTLNKAKLKEILVVVPPLPEQKRIVAILDEAFASIDTAVANTEKNLANARELFESYLNAVVDTAFRKSTVTVLSDLAEEITDGDHMPPPKAPSGVPFITIKNIDKRTRKVDFENTFRVPRSYFEGLKPNKRPRKGDVLYTVTGSFGIPVVVGQKTEFCFQRHIGLIRPKSGTDSSWLYYLLMSPQIFAQATDGATGTAQKTVSLKVLRSFRVPTIPLDQQVDNVQQLDNLLADVEGLESIYRQQLRNLGELKQSLLQKAFSGELTAGKAASDAMRQVEEIA